MDGELHQTRDVVDIQFAHEAGAVGVDCLGAELQPGGDFFGTDSFHQQREHLVFACAESFQGVVRRGLVSGG